MNSLTAKLHFSTKIVGQFGNGQFSTGQFGAGQFGKKSKKTDNLATDNLAPGQFGTGQFGNRTICHQTFDMIKLNLIDHFWQRFEQMFSFCVFVCPFEHKYG